MIRINLKCVYTTKGLKLYQFSLNQLNWFPKNCYQSFLERPPIIFFYFERTMRLVKAIILIDACSFYLINLSINDIFVNFKEFYLKQYWNVTKIYIWEKHLFLKWSNERKLFYWKPKSYKVPFITHDHQIQIISARKV